MHYVSGKVFIALRGDDKIMVFNEKENSLEVSYSFKVGSYPRHFAVSEANNLIIVACQKGNVVQKYYATLEKIVLLSEIGIVTPSVIVAIEK